MNTWLITGGAGFIGGAFVRRLRAEQNLRIVNLDALTYAGNLDSLPHPDANYVFVHGSITDRILLNTLFADYQPSVVVNFAAESHVDRSIDGPAAFVETNVVGTTCLLDSSLAYYHTLSVESQIKFRFLHISTDEVYGSLGAEGLFTEDSPYAPNSPYSASKAASDMFVRAYHHTFGLPTLITNCSNNYGPYQFPEKLIPLMILNALEGKPLPVYGDGKYIRDWLYVDDHCDAIELVLRQGRIGETYNIGGNNQWANIDIVHLICDTIDELAKPKHAPCRDLIEFVKDRPGHDRRYAIDATKIESQLGWRPKRDFQLGLRDTIQWYLDHRAWVENITSGNYQRERLEIGSV